MFAEDIAAVDQPGFASDPNADLLNRLATELIGEKLDLCLIAICGAANDIDKIVEVGRGRSGSLRVFQPWPRLGGEESGSAAE